MGGEEAGGIGIAAHMPERDGILACLILCELMAKTDAPLGVLGDQLEDSFGKTRKQQMLVYPVVLEQVNREKKESMSGQMSLFDFFSEEEKKEYEMQYPDVGEYDDAQKLALEKDVLGNYVSGHPLEKYMNSIEKQTTARSTDFEPDEVCGRAIV